METSELVKELIEKLKTQTSSKLLFGEPIVKDSKTVIPVGKISVCTIGNFNIFRRCNWRKDENCETNDSHENIEVKPVGVIEITEEETKFIPIRDLKKTALIFSLGLFVGLFLFGKKK